VIGIADLTGVYGVSFVLVMVNEVASRWMELGIAWMGSRGNPMGNFLAPPKAPTIAVALTLVLVMTYSLARSGSASPSDTVRIALVQPNTLVTETMTYEDLETHFERYSEYTYKADDETPDLIIWPASSLPGSLSDRSVKILMGPLLRKLEAPLLAGGAGGEKMSPAQGDRRSYANTEFLLRPGGRPGGQYAKQHLVPFNEYLPLDGVFHWPRWVTTLEGNYRAGDKYTVFVLKEGRFGVPICWESLFPDLFRRFVNKGARFMVNVTNEAYMGDSAGPYQTLAMNIFRAVENRVTLARAATTGISAFIGPDGRVLGTVRSTDGKELFVAGILVRDIPLLVKRTFYTKHGDVFAWTIIAISLLGLAVALRSRPVKGI